MHAIKETLHDFSKLIASIYKKQDTIPNSITYIAAGLFEGKRLNPDQVNKMQHAKAVICRCFSK